jgi:hypothetical protein
VSASGARTHRSGTVCRMVWYGAPPTPWTAIVATRWWQLDRAPTEHAQTESVPSALVRRWVSFPQGQAPAVAELRTYLYECISNITLTRAIIHASISKAFNGDGGSCVLAMARERNYTSSGAH